MFSLKRLIKVVYWYQNGKYFLGEIICNPLQQVSLHFLKVKVDIYSAKSWNIKPCQLSKNPQKIDKKWQVFCKHLERGHFLKVSHNVVMEPKVFSTAP